MENKRGGEGGAGGKGGVGFGGKPGVLGKMRLTTWEQEPNPEQ